MTDKFKFRVWDRVNKIMIYPEEIWFKKDKFSVIQRRLGCAWSITDSLNADLMENLLLEDSYGTTVFEDDIVKISRLNRLSGNSFDEYILMNRKNAEFHQDIMGAILKTEIVGNKHENPEKLVLIK